MKLIIGSNSPRRHQLIQNLGYHFSIMNKDVDESYDPSAIAPRKVALYLAELKNEMYRSDLGDEVLLTADTVVLLNDRVLGKPTCNDEAFEMLSSMSGQTHQVVSGVCISSNSKTISFDDQVEVEMGNLSTEEIKFYIDNYQPFDKAGGYGIQEWIGMVGINKIIGSFYTVMGLPVQKVYQSLKDDFGLLPLPPE